MSKPQGCRTRHALALAVGLVLAPLGCYQASGQSCTTGDVEHDDAGHSFDIKPPLGCGATAGTKGEGESCVGDAGPDPSLCANCTCSTFFLKDGTPLLSVCGRLDDAGPWLACGVVGDSCTACAGSNCAPGECRQIGDTARACCPLSTLTDPVSGLSVGERCPE